ncbi:hypothetical protein C0991_006143, partial [Blastosporella zonata]
MESLEKALLDILSITSNAICDNQDDLFSYTWEKNLCSQVLSDLFNLESFKSSIPVDYSPSPATRTCSQLSNDIDYSSLKFPGWPEPTDVPVDEYFAPASETSAVQASPP